MKDFNRSVEFKQSLIDGQQQLEQNSKTNEIEIKIEVKDNLILIREDDEEQEQSDDDEVYSEFFYDNSDTLQTQNSNLAECPECLELFEQDVIGKHIAKHLKAKAYACDKCEYKSDKASRLEAHCLKVHKSEPPPRRQKRTELNIRKQCSLCGNLVKNLVEHLKITHGQLKRYYCDKCDYKCYFRAKIERHLQRHIPKEFKSCFKCEQCDFRKLILLLLKHSLNKFVILETNRKDTLKNHYHTMHQQNRERKETCLQCEKTFYNKSQLNTHIKSVHEKIKNQLCNYCGKSFYTIKDLQMHEKRHFEKSEKCQQCESIFYCKSDLRRHTKNMHTSPKIVCEFPDCGKKFHSNSKLNYHVKVRHQQVKEHVCKYSYCQSKFAQYNNLKRHIDTVHKAMRIKCIVENCKYSVSRKDKYKNHLLSQHKSLDEQARDAILKSAKYE